VGLSGFDTALIGLDLLCPVLNRQAGIVPQRVPLIE
jgi:hypothetical protein